MYRPGATLKGVTTPTSTAAPIPALLNGAALPFPVEMVIDATGEPFTALIAGDWPGHSPSLLGVGRDGKFAIGSFEELSVTDARVLPNDLGYTIRARQQRKIETGTTRGAGRIARAAAATK